MICKVIWERMNGDQAEQGGLELIDALTLLSGISKDIGPEPGDIRWIQIERDEDYQ